jgi:hypothetical protein
MHVRVVRSPARGIRGIRRCIRDILPLHPRHPPMASAEGIRSLGTPPET